MCASGSAYQPGKMGLPEYVLSFIRDEDGDEIRDEGQL